MHNKNKQQMKIFKKRSNVFWKQIEIPLNKTAHKKKQMYN